MDQDIYCASAEEAVARCRELALSGQADLFRGQSFDWPVIAPSSFRGADADKAIARSRRDKFVEWARAVPQMFSYQGNDAALIAIAQHYGIPTNFLDLTTSPEIAELFARGKPDKAGGGDAVIYVFKSSDLAALPDFSLLRIDVVNLWRLQSQHGLFLIYGDDAASEHIRNSAIRIHYPRKEILPEEAIRLYPTRKSPLELTIDQWIYRYEIGQLYTNLGDIQFHNKVRRYTYPGAFRWRQVPELTADWVSNNPNWLLSPTDDIAEVVNAPIFEVSLADSESPVEAYKLLYELFEEPVQAYQTSGKGFEFAIKIQGHDARAKDASLLLNRCWDGVRVHPYPMESVVACMAATALGLIRAVTLPGTASWEEALWGKVETIDTAPVGGHLEAAGVSKAKIVAARHNLYNNNLLTYYAEKSSNDAFFIMDYVVDPWILFSFEKLSDLFVTQFIPSCISSILSEAISSEEEVISSLWGISFNPALLGFVTRFGFRFYSPIATEENVERLIIISPDMNREHLKEVFFSALPIVLQGGEPFIARFHGYGFDTREVWEIERVIEQCKDIVDFGGLSVLDVLPAEEEDKEHNPPIAPNGLYAIHVWAMAKGYIGSGAPQHFELTQEIFQIFLGDLQQSNADLEALGKSQADWPLS